MDWVGGFANWPVFGLEAMIYDEYLDIWRVFGLEAKWAFFL
jgi:hypothetical protein